MGIFHQFENQIKFLTKEIGKKTNLKSSFRLENFRSNYEWVIFKIKLNYLQRDA